MNRLIVLAAMSALAMAVTGCGRECKRARTQIIEPTQRTAAYLVTEPTGQALAAEGCTTLLEDLASVPTGADRIRRLAQDRYTSSRAYCARPVTSTRLRCTRGHTTTTCRPGAVLPHPHHPHPGHPHRPPHSVPPVCHTHYVPGQCYNEVYSFCAEWAYDTNVDPEFAVAMDLARDLDRMYENTQQMCSKATGGDYAGAEASARELLALIQTEVRPEGERVYARACR